jgi:glucose/arabinose dehydrogenase
MALENGTNQTASAMKRMLSVCAVALFTAYATLVILAQPKNATRVPACDPDNGGISLPSGFCAQVAADNLGVGRHMVVAANGDLFVAVRNAERAPGAVIGLRDADGDGKFEVQQQFAAEGGTGIALRTGYLYLGQDTRIVRYPMKEGELKPSGQAEVVATLPDQQGHRAKGLAFDGRGGMYVNVGAPSNACQATGQADRKPEVPGQMPCPLLENHGGIWRFDENRTGQTQQNGGRRYATGMRQPYALAWHEGALYAVQHGRDQLDTLFPKRFNAKQNAELPSEELLGVTEGANFGWPYCYHDWQQGKRVQSPEYGGDGKKEADCAKYPAPIAGFPGHWAPGSLMFYTGSQLPSKYRSGAFIAFQGSWNRAPEPQGGYNVIFQPLKGATAAGRYEVFADGFAGTKPLMKPEDAKFRPCGLAQARDGSIYISDEVKGRIWRVIYRGDAPTK